MGINITHTNSFQFENRENLRNAAKDILNKQGASSQTVNKIIDRTVFDSNTQLGVLQASTQITINNSLKETLKYLQQHASRKAPKKPVLGELWDIANNPETEYEGELLNFEIDSSAKNIFAA